MKEFVKQLIPPILLNVIKRRMTSSMSSNTLYNSYEEALSACQDNAYEQNDVVKLVVEKNIIYKQEINSKPLFDLGVFRTLFGLGLANNGKGTLSVLDFGGGGGYHYTIAKVAFGDSIDLRWNIIETKAMASEGTRIADDSLKFFYSINEAKKDMGLVDLVFTSGALQYCPDPLHFLKELTDVGAKFLFITRTALSDSHQKMTTIQVSNLSANGPGPLPSNFQDRKVSYPITFVSKNEVEKILTEKYNIRFIIIEDKDVHNAGEKKISMYGYFCVLK